MSDLELLVRRMEALGGVMPTSQDQCRLAMITVCDSMTRSGNTVDQVREVLCALGLYIDEPVQVPAVRQPRK